jgi:hypothetical protein
MALEASLFLLNTVFSSTQSWSVLRPTCKHLSVLQVHIYTTCFGQYGHPQVLKSSGGNCCYSAAIVCVPSMRTYVVLGVLCSLLFSVVCFINSPPAFFYGPLSHIKMLVLEKDITTNINENRKARWQEDNIEMYSRGRRITTWGSCRRSQYLGLLSMTSKQPWKKHKIKTKDEEI